LLFYVSQTPHNVPSSRRSAPPGVRCSRLPSLTTWGCFSRFISDMITPMLARLLASHRLLLPVPRTVLHTVLVAVHCNIRRRSVTHDRTTTRSLACRNRRSLGPRWPYDVPRPLVTPGDGQASPSLLALRPGSSSRWSAVIAMDSPSGQGLHSWEGRHPVNGSPERTGRGARVGVAGRSDPDQPPTQAGPETGRISGPSRPAEAALWMMINAKEI
jgi:hypothetical protein